MQVCSVDGCNGKRLARGLCKAHYNREYKAGRLKPKRAAALEEKFWARVNKSNGCWLWTGTVQVRGYGAFFISKARGYVKAHRFSYELNVGPIPDGMLVCHRCDVRNCVRPDHLFLGDNAINMADMTAKRRHVNQAKTHCIRGHEFTPENTYHPPKRPWTRLCRECRRTSKVRAKAA